MAEPLSGGVPYALCDASVTALRALIRPAGSEELSPSSLVGCQGVRGATRCARDAAVTSSEGAASAC